MRWKLLALAGLASTAALAFLYPYVTEVALLRPLYGSFENGDLSRWKFFGGSWITTEGVLKNVSGARGDKGLCGSARWADYVVETDLRFDSEAGGYGWGDAGIVCRATNASIGVDAYDGYYTGIGIEQSVLVFGRSNYSWAGLRFVPMPATVRGGVWYKLRLVAKGCYFSVTAREEGAAEEARLTYFDNECTKRSGAAGVRTYGVRASWRNFVVHAVDER
jgi:hypothetical protein